jgi:hypothetical protein
MLSKTHTNLLIKETSYGKKTITKLMKNWAISKTLFSDTLSEIGFKLLD